MSRTAALLFVLTIHDECFMSDCGEDTHSLSLSLCLPLSNFCPHSIKFSLPAINILHLRLDESEGFSCLMEKRKRWGKVSIDRWGVNGSREG